MATLEEILADQVAQRDRMENQAGLDNLIEKMRVQDNKYVPKTVDEGFVDLPGDYFDDPKPKVQTKANPLYTNVQSVKDANPNAIFINSGGPAQQANTQIQPVQQVNNQISDSIFEGVRAQMDSISKLADKPLEQQAGLISLQASVASTSSEIMKKTRELAESQVGLPGLEAALANAERLDRASPEWGQHLVDSNETRVVRQQFEKAQTKALELSRRLVLENPTIQSMEATLKGFMAVTNANIQKRLGRDDKQQEMVEQIALTIPADSVKAISYLVPGVENDPTKAAGVGLVAMKTKNPDVMAILSPNFTNDQLLPLAYSNNKAALQIAPKMHSELTGQNERDAKAEITYAYNLVNTEQFFVDSMKTLAVKDPKYAAVLSDYTKMSLMDTGKIGEEKKKQFRTLVTEQVLNKKRTNDTLNDVDKWNGDITLRSNPEVAVLLDSIQTAKPGPVSVKTLMDEYVNKAPRELKAQRMQFLNDAAKSYAEKNNKGLYGNIDLTTLQSQLKLSRSSFSGGLGKLFDSTDPYSANGKNIPLEADPDILDINPTAFTMGFR
jgi:hypothetical protein